MRTRSPTLSRRGLRAARRFVVGLALLATLAFTAACEGPEGPAGPPGPGVATPQPLVASGAALDVHTHVMSPELAAALGVPADWPAADAEDLLALLDEANVERAVVLSTAYFAALPDNAAMSAENDYAAAEVAKHPDRLIPICGINPLRESAAEEVDRCIDELGMRGVKLHLAGSEVDLRQPDQVAALTAVFDRVSERGVPVLIHAADPNGITMTADALWNLGVLIATHPDVRLAFAHCGSSGFDVETLNTLLFAFEASPPVLSPDNLWLDTSSCLAFFKDAPLSTKEEIVWRLRKWGLERVLFGSDYLLVSPRETPAEALETISSYPFTQEEIDLILSNDGSAWLEGQ